MALDAAITMAKTTLQTGNPGLALLKTAIGVAKDSVNNAIETKQKKEEELKKL